HQDVRLGATRSCGQIHETILEGVLLPRQALHEVATHHFAAVLHAEQGMAQRGPVTARQLAGEYAVARQQELGASLLALFRRERFLPGERAPAADRRQVGKQATRLAAARAAPGPRSLRRSPR